MIIYALTSGALDSIELHEVSKFQNELFNYLDNDLEGQSILEEIRTTKNLPDKSKLDQVISKFKEQF